MFHVIIKINAFVIYTHKAKAQITDTLGHWISNKECVSAVYIINNKRKNKDPKLSLLTNTDDLYCLWLQITNFHVYHIYKKSRLLTLRRLRR